jgi:hypothetical protein
MKTLLNLIFAQKVRKVIYESNKSSEYQLFAALGVFVVISMPQAMTRYVKQTT